MREERLTARTLKSRVTVNSKWPVSFTHAFFITAVRRGVLFRLLRLTLKRTCSVALQQRTHYDSNVTMARCIALIGGLLHSPQQRICIHPVINGQILLYPSCDIKCIRWWYVITLAATCRAARSIFPVHSFPFLPVLPLLSFVFPSTRASIFISGRELAFTFAICHRRSVCRLSVCLW